MVAVSAMITGTAICAERDRQSVGIAFEHVVANKDLAFHAAEFTAGPHLVDATPVVTEQVGAAYWTSCRNYSRHITESGGAQRQQLPVGGRSIAVAHDDDVRSTTAMLQAVADPDNRLHRSLAQRVGSMSAPARGEVEHHHIEGIATGNASATEEDAARRTLRGIGQGDTERAVTDEGKGGGLPGYGYIHATHIVAVGHHVLIAQTGQACATEEVVQGTVALHFAEPDDIHGSKPSGIEHRTCQPGGLGGKALGSPLARTFGKEIIIEMQTVVIHVEEVLHIVRHDPKGIRHTVCRNFRSRPALGGNTQRK